MSPRRTSRARPSPRPTRPPRRCPNCRTPRHGPWCSGCGQALASRRISGRELLQQITAQFWDWDMPILRTVRGLTVCPGRTCRSYLIGRRRRYTNPVRYYLLLAALYVLVMAAVGFSPSAIVTGAGGATTPAATAPPSTPPPAADGAPEDPAAARARRQRAIAQYIRREAPHRVESAINLVGFVAAPGTALFMTVLMRGRGVRRRRYAEHLAVAFLLSGHVMLLAMVAALTARWTGRVGIVAIQLGEIAYVAWAVVGAYGLGVVGAVWRSAVLFVLNMLATLIAGTLLVMGWIAWLFLSGAIWERVG